MKRFFLCFFTAFFSTVLIGYAENNFSSDSIQSRNLDEVLILGNSAGKSTPVAQSNLKAAEIKSLTVANNLPHVLWMVPSLVATSENGTASGYSSLRIRGTDASRINITLNGIPLNNPESHEVYWVNIPDMTSALNSIQVQRGVGTSTNGPGAFGASINMTTRNAGADAYFESSTTAGSYGTFQQNLAVGTGVFGNGNSFDLRYSNLNSNGYIRNGWCDHESLFASFSKRFENSALKLNYIHGSQHTGITWEGISESKMKSNPRYNPAGEITDGVYYDNESDNYYQHHFQLFYTNELSESLLMTLGANYTDGYGYYEQYKQDKSFSSMNIPNQVIDGNTFQETDLIRRKNMDNGFYTANVSLKYQKKQFNVLLGSMYTYYNGDHFANLLWVENNQNIPFKYEWSRNHAEKTDANVFAKTELMVSDKLNFYVDLQYRHVNYELSGIDDDDLLDLTQTRTWDFFNPKAGVFYDINRNNKIFASVSIAHREPTRADLKDAVKLGSSNNIRAEKLTDYELGYTFDNNILMMSANIYYMKYKDQLVPTGRLNEVGYKLMSNVENSYRAGVELMGGYKPAKWLELFANATFSRSKVLDYTAWFETYNNSNDWAEAEQLSQYFDQASLPFSPEVIVAAGVNVNPARNLKVGLNYKFVSDQYVTNTQNEDLKLPSYNNFNLNIAYDFKLLNFADSKLSFFVNNLFSAKYSSNAWGWEAHFRNGDQTITDKGLYPVAPANYLIKFAVKI